ncbi:7tm 7 domain containing protein, partial [Asbolus verrucosus]
MSFKLLKVMFTVGKFLVITPSRIEMGEDAFPRKAHVFLMIGLVTAGLLASSIYRGPYYMEYIPMKMATQILLDASLYMLNIYSILTTIRKKPQWCRLIKNLKKTQNISIGETQNYWWFALANAIFWVIQFYESFIFTKMMGVGFYAQYGVEYVQLYLQFFIYFLLQVFLKMFKSRYQSITKTLSDELYLMVQLQRRPLVREGHSLTYLNKIKHNICVLKETVDTFNDIFGWPIVFIITFTSLQVLIYLQGLFVRSRRTLETIIYNVAVILWHCAATFFNIFLCDSVSHEGQKILTLAYSMEKYLLKQGENENEELSRFISVVKDNYPNFSAARFFSVDRTTVFGIFDAIITFLIVMIQFESNHESKGSGFD